MTTMAVLATAALVAAGCGDDESDSTSTSASSTKTTAAQSDSMDTMDASTGASLISSPGVDLRYTLDRLLGEHAALALVGLNKTIAGEQDAKAVVDALGDNTDDLSAAIGSVYGDDAAKSFKDQWTAHIGFFADYATGVATKDNAKKAAARKQLDGYQKSFSTFLSEAAGLDADAGAAALGMHVKQLTAAMDQFGAGKYEQSYASSREAYAHMFGTADALAAAISKQKPDEFGMGDVTQQAADTRALLGQQLGEHAFLATVALNKTMTGAKDATQAVAALDANTVDLGTTIGSVYGDEAEAAFLKQWREHIGFFVNYATATVEGDQAKADQAKTDLDGYASGFDEFLSGATGADKGTFEPGLKEHVEQLIGAIDATQDGDVDEAWGLERDAYSHMYMAADAITGAIVEQNPDKFGS